MSNGGAVDFGLQICPHDPKCEMRKIDGTQ